MRTISIICLLLLPADAQAQQEESDLVPAGKRLLRHVRYLASDELEGRRIGSAGIAKAASYIRKRFADAGLDVTGVDGGALQTFAMTTGTEEGDSNSLVFRSPGGASHVLTEGTDFRVCSFGRPGVVAGGIAFCGYAIDSRKPLFNEFAGIDLEGNVAIIMRRTPRQDAERSPFGGPRGRISRHADLRSKVSNAARHGALAVIFANDPWSLRDEESRLKKAAVDLARKIEVLATELDAEVFQLDKDERAEIQAEYDELVEKQKAKTQSIADRQFDSLMRFGHGGNLNEKAVPIFHATVAAVDRLLEASLGKTLKQLETEIDSDLQPRSTVLTGWTATGQSDIAKVEADVSNVIGVLEGAGPLAEETIVVGAHYDHVGRGGSGSLAKGSNEIHNGADDNASGTAGLLELARRLARRKEPLPRRIVFVAFTAEEVGLIGSKRYVENPLFPLESTVAMFNMDMIGRLTADRLQIYGTGTAEGWSDWIEEMTTRRGFNVTMQPQGLGPSDHASFYRSKIPVLHFFTGTHPDYHRPGDDWQRINAEGLSRVVDLVEESIVTTAQAPERPTYLAVQGNARIQSATNRPFSGILPDMNAEGFRVANVTIDGPAEKAGLQSGDRVVEVGGKAITSVADYQTTLQGYKAGDTIAVVIDRRGQGFVTRLKLAIPK